MFPETGTRPPAAITAASEPAAGIVVPGDGPAECDRFDTPARISIVRGPTHS